MIKRFFSLLLTVCMVMHLCSAAVCAVDMENVIASGIFGENLAWELSNDYVLTISGEGAMDNYEMDEFYIYSTAPWGMWASQIEKIIIEDGVSAIGSYAFVGCSALEKVEVSDSVGFIGDHAFAKFTGLTPCVIVFYGNAMVFTEQSFSDCYNTCGVYMADKLGWESVVGDYYANMPWRAMESDGTIDSGITEDDLWWDLKIDGTLIISGQGEISYFPYLDVSYTRLVIEDGVTAIGSYAFCMIGNLKAVTIPASVTVIGERAFDECTNLCEIIFKGNAPIFGEYAFSYAGYYDGATVYYPANNSTWTEDVRQNYGGNLIWVAKEMEGSEEGSEEAEITSGTCGANLTWTLENGVLTIWGSGAMADYHWQDNPTPWDVNAVEQIVFDEDCAITYIGKQAFHGCTNLKEVKLPDTVTSIGSMAYYNCSNLSSVILAEGLKTIGEEAFCMTNALAEITIPASVECIESMAFAYGGMTDVTMLGQEPALGDRIFGGCNITTYAPWISCSSDQWGTLVYTGVADKTAPAITLVTPEIGASLRGETTFTVTASDDIGLSKIKMQRPDADVDIRVVSGTTATESFVIDTTGMEEGSTFTLYFIAVDTSDNKTEITCTFIIDNVDEPVDTIAPVISDFWPSSEDQITFCHDGTIQIAASDETMLSRAEIWAAVDNEDPVLVGEGFANNDNIYSIQCDFVSLAGSAVLTYKVYDTAGNCSEQTAEVTIRPYELPKTPENLTVKAGFRSAELTWEYTGDLQTLKQFNIYDGGGGGMLVASVKNYQYVIRELTEEISYRVAAVDIYGEQSFSTDPIVVTPVLTEDIAPEAVLSVKELVAVVGTPITLSGSASTDNDRIASYKWGFGDGSSGEGINATHTYSASGTYTVTLTVTDRSGNSDMTTAEVTVYDTLGENATHAVLTVTVKDGYIENTPAIEKATVTVYNENGFEAAAMTNGTGEAVLIVPKGVHTITVIKEGFSGKMMQIEVVSDANGTAAETVYLAASGVDIVGGELTVTTMTHDEIIEAGIDVSDPANNHVVKQEVTIRFRPTPELAFDLDIQQFVNAVGDLLIDKSRGFGWQTFTPEPTPDPLPNPDRPNIVTPGDWGTPNYDVGVFPVGDSAYMVIYGQSHWLKEMFNVELIIFNNSYAEDITDCIAELQLPEGLSLANMLDGEQHEKVKVGNGTIEYIGKTDENGTAIGSNIRQVNWYVHGDAEGDYSLTAAVNGFVGGTPFEKIFTAEEAIHVYAGSALKLTVTMPKSAYAEKDYAVKFSLTNVSERPIYNLSFGLDSAQQFVAERMSDGTVGETERKFSNEDFEDKMTYGLPVLEPGKSFNLILRTTFAYEHQFVEWAVGKIPGLEVGYAVADVFVATLEGSTTEIPVEIVLEDVKKDSLFQWIWDETIGALKDNAKDAIIEFVDDEIFQGFPVVEKGVAYFEIIKNVHEYIEDDAVEYTPTVNVTDGVLCVSEGQAAEYLNMFSTYSLRRSAVPGVLCWTDAEDAVISEDGRTMSMPNGGTLFVLRLGETEETPEIKVTAYYVDDEGKVQEFTRTLTTDQTYTPGLKEAAHILMEDLTENRFEVPAGDDMTEVHFHAQLIAENGDILLRASNEAWSVIDSEGNAAQGMFISNGTLVIDSNAKAGTYTVKLALDGTEAFKEQPLVLIMDNTDAEHKCEDKNFDHRCDNGCDKIFGQHLMADGKHICDYCGETMSDCSDSNDADHDCDICGAENITNHSFSQAWSYDKDTHWHDSACGHNVISAEAAHEYGIDRTCDICGYIRPNNVVVPVLPIDPPYTDDTENDNDTPNTEIPWQNPFHDVNESDWFYEDVKFMSEKDIMIGTDDTIFAPDATLTRAMLVTVLWRLEGEPVVDYIMPFADVESEQWYTEAVRWAAAEGIVKGYGNGSFGVNDAVTREQIMAILHRYAVYKELDSGMIIPMIPQYEYSIWAENDLLWADMVGLTSDLYVDIFDMTKDASRAEIAAYLRRFCDVIGVR